MWVPVTFLWSPTSSVTSDPWYKRDIFLHTTAAHCIFSLSRDNSQKEKRSIYPGDGCDVVNILEDQQFVNLMLTLNFSKHIVVAKSIGLLPSDWLISYLCCQQTLCLTKWQVCAVKWKCISPYLILATGVSRDKQKSKSQIFIIVQPKQIVLVNIDDGILRTFASFSYW